MPTINLDTSSEEESDEPAQRRAPKSKAKSKSKAKAKAKAGKKRKQRDMIDKEAQKMEREMTVAAHLAESQSFLWGVLSGQGKKVVDCEWIKELLAAESIDCEKEDDVKMMIDMFSKSGKLSANQFADVFEACNFKVSKDDAVW